MIVLDRDVMVYVNDCAQVVAGHEFVTRREGLRAHASLGHDFSACALWHEGDMRIPVACAPGVDWYGSPERRRRVGWADQALAFLQLAGYKTAMGVVRIELPVARFPAVERQAVTISLVESAHEWAGPATELHSRPGREVWGWVARDKTGEHGLAGLVLLVCAGVSGRSRWSIGRLHVEARFWRRGIGLTLVATAVRFAGTRGAPVVHAETLEAWPEAMAFWRAARLAAAGPPARIPASGESRKTAEG